MNNQQSPEERIWEYIDGTLPSEEKQFVESMIAAQQEWATLYRELLDTHKMMQQHLELEEPSMRFTQNVMEEISRLYITPATRNYINKKIIWSIAGVFLTMILGFLAYGFSQVNWSAPSSGQLPGGISTPDWSRMYDNNLTNIFIMINVLLALMLLDMYLNKRKMKHQADHRTV